MNILFAAFILVLVGIVCVSTYAAIIGIKLSLLLTKKQPKMKGLYADMSLIDRFNPGTVWLKLRLSDTRANILAKCLQISMNMLYSPYFHLSSIQYLASS